MKIRKQLYQKTFSLCNTQRTSGSHRENEPPSTKIRGN